MLSTYSKEDILGLPLHYRRNLINCLSGFKSACLMGTIDREKRTNLALVSSVIHIGANPALMGVLMRPHVVERHSIENVAATGHFTLNHITEEIYRQGHQSSARYPKEQSEFDMVGLTPAFGDIHPAPYVAESPIKIGLQIKERIKIQTNATQMFVGEIVELILPEQAIGQDGFLDLQQTGSLTVSGLDSYHTTERLTRLSYAKPNQTLQDLPLKE
ncbi:MAG: flavin reductase [Bacteroidota bacterium]